MLTKWNKQKGLVKNFRIAPTRFFWNILSTVLDLVLDLLVCRWNETFCNQSRRTISDLPQKLYIYIHTHWRKYYFRPYIFILFSLWSILFIFTIFSPYFEKCIPFWFLPSSSVTEISGMHYWHIERLCGH